MRGARSVELQYVTYSALSSESYCIFSQFANEFSTVSMFDSTSLSARQNSLSGGVINHIGFI